MKEMNKKGFTLKQCVLYGVIGECVSIYTYVFVYSPWKETYMMCFVGKHSTSWDSQGKFWGTRGLSHSRTEQHSTSSDLDNISDRVSYFSTRRASLPDGQAETMRLVPDWTQVVSGRSLLQTQRTSSVRLAERGYLVRVTERCGNGGEEVWVRITTGSQNALLGFQKRVSEKQCFGSGPQTMPRFLPSAGEWAHKITSEPRENSGDKDSAGQHMGQNIRTEKLACLHLCQCGAGGTFRSIDTLCVWEFTVEPTQIKKPLGFLGKGTLQHSGH